MVSLTPSTVTDMPEHDGTPTREEHLAAEAEAERRGLVGSSTAPYSMSNPIDDFVMKPLVWTEQRKPNKACCYNHCIAETPFGEFLLTWKGWKGRPADTMGFDETPWGDVWYDYWGSVEEAQKWAEEMLFDKIKSMLAQTHNGKVDNE